MKNIFILVAFFVALPLFGQQSNFSVEDIAKVRHVTSAKISPDGNLIAYTLSRPRRPVVEEDGGSWDELYIVDKEGTVRPYITGESGIDKVAWLPDGSGISFLDKRNKDANTSVYFIPVNGGEARKILEHNTGIGNYCWNGMSEIIFLAQEKDEKAEKVTKQGFSQKVYEEDYTHTKVWKGKPVFTIDYWQKSEYSIQKLNISGTASAIKCSPDQKYLAVAIAPTSLVDDYYMSRNIHIYDFSKNEVVLQLKSEGKLGDFEWSPNSHHLAIIGAADINDPESGRLMVASFTNPELTNILPAYEGTITAIAWQDHETIMFSGDEHVWSTFNKVKLDGEIKTIVGREHCIIRDFSLAQNGMKGSFIVDSPEHAREVYYMQHGDLKPARLTNSNVWLATKQIAKQEAISYKTKDGLEIDGLLIYPLNQEENKKYPLVVIVHGGPEAHYSNGWLTGYSTPGQVLANEGFVVFYPNYRGSTGRGLAFVTSSQSDTGGKEFEDIIDGVNYLVSLGFVDKNKVGITGGSYGGFATAWCSTYYSEYFAAGVMSVGISEQIAKYGTTDIPKEMYLVHALKYPWENWEFFRERSPLTHFQKCRTPLLIFHGEKDSRVHPSQSLMLYRYIKTYGKSPVRLVLYPNEGHGNRRAAARFDFSIRLVQWMKHYLQGTGGNLPDYSVDYESYQK